MMMTKRTTTSHKRNYDLTYNYDDDKENNTPGTAGGPGGRDRTLAVKSRKTDEKSPFFL